MKKRPLAFATVVFIVLLAVLQLCFPEWFQLRMPEGIEELEEKNITLMGTVSKISSSERYGKKTTTIHIEDVFLTSSNTFKNKISKITDGNQSIICYLSSEEKLKLGNPVLIRGELKSFQPARNPGGFDFRKHYHHKKILFSLRSCEILKKTENFYYIRQTLYELRLRSEKILERYLSKEHAAVMKVLLLGEKEKLDEETKLLYQKNGIAHILSISGLHISMIGIAVFTLLSLLRLPISVNCSFSMILLFLFGLMVGFTPSTVRAIFMFSMMLMAKILKRSYDMLTALALAAIFLIVENPLIIQDCSFQLSFTAILGIAIVYPAFQLVINEWDDFIWQISFGKIVIYKLIHVLLNSFCPSFAVSLTTAPILIYYFHEISFLSVLLNLIVLPFLFLLLAAGMFMIISSNIFWGFYASSVSIDWKMEIINTFEKISSFFIMLILEFYRKACLLFQELPFGRINVEMPSFGEIFLYYSLLILATLIVNKKRQLYQFYLCLFLMGFLFLPPNEEFSVWGLDVGQGDCNVIFTEEGNTYIIDCGSTSQKQVGKYVLIPFLKSMGCNKVDGIFVSHLDQDHYNGITDLLKYSKEENLPVEKIYIYEKEREKGLKLFEKEVGRMEADVIPLAANAFLKDGDVCIECLYPFQWQEGLEGNDASLVLSLRYKNMSALFMGDLEKKGEEILVGELRENQKLKKLGCHFLKVGHHGSNSSSYESLLNAMEADVAIISVGKENPYGFPHKDLIHRLEKKNMKIFRTDENAAIQIRYNGEQFSVIPYLPYK